MKLCQKLFIIWIFIISVKSEIGDFQGPQIVQKRGPQEKLDEKKIITKKHDKSRRKSSRHGSFTSRYGLPIDKLPKKTCLEHDNCSRKQFCLFEFGMCHSCIAKGKRCTEDVECCGSHRKRKKNICYSTRCMSESKVHQLEDCKTTGKKRACKKRRKGCCKNKGNRCKTNDDCKATHCCIQRNGSGRCQPLLTLGKNCSPKVHFHTRKTGGFKRCPCHTGLSCSESAQHDGYGKTFTKYICQN